MCRWLIYKGDRITLADVITRPKNSLIHQAFDARHLPGLELSELYCAAQAAMRNSLVNADGFGIAWYDSEAESNDGNVAGVTAPPAVFRVTTPAWSCVNLRELAAVVQSTTILAHVRAASPGLPVLEVNCHPFRMGRITFMHNGGIAGFSRIKRAIQSTLRDDIFNMLHGNTDSEHVFALFMNQLHDSNGLYTAEQLAQTMENTIMLIQQLQRDAGVTDYSSMNFAVTDGHSFIATRVRNDPRGDPPSLYWLVGSHFEMENGDGRMSSSPNQPTDTILCCSEPLTFSSEWKLLPKDSMLIVSGAVPCLHYEVVKLKNLYQPFDAFVSNGASQVRLGPRMMHYTCLFVSASCASFHVCCIDYCNIAECLLDPSHHGTAVASSAPISPLPRLHELKSTMSGTPTNPAPLFTFTSSDIPIGSGTPIRAVSDLYKTPRAVALAQRRDIKRAFGGTSAPSTPSSHTPPTFIQRSMSVADMSIDETATGWEPSTTISDHKERTVITPLTTLPSASSSPSSAPSTATITPPPPPPPPATTATVTPSVAVSAANGGNNHTSSVGEDVMAGGTSSVSTSQLVVLAARSFARLPVQMPRQAPSPSIVVPCNTVCTCGRASCHCTTSVIQSTTNITIELAASKVLPSTSSLAVPSSLPPPATVLVPITIPSSSSPTVVTSPPSRLVHVEAQMSRLENKLDLLLAALANRA